MRILTWNINGVRTIPQYHPWNTLKAFDDILNYLEADIICFQEMKSSRQALPKQVALPPSYDSFFSFPIRKTGYSGTAIYTRRRSVVALKAEEGLTGLLQPKPPFPPEERISAAERYPTASTDDSHDLSYKDLDSEGRAVVVDFGLFVLINVYCPNDGTGTEERDKFKMDYHHLLETRVNGLIKEGREVIVVGDLNACAAVEDHCEGRLMVERGLAEGLEGEDGFWGKDCRRWLRDWLVLENGSTGKMVDIVRKLWPDRKAMYTCWNTKISARETNYGTRIDFILITPGLVPWVKGADIQPHIKGSDHCPVFLDLADGIINADGTTTKLSDVLGAHSNNDQLAEPPRIAAKYWDEHQQKLLSNFFGKKEPKERGPSSSKGQPSSSSATVDTPRISVSPNDPDSQNIRTFPSESAISATPTPSKRKIVVENPKSHFKKAKTTFASQDTLKPKGEEKKPAQPTIAGYFTKPETSTSKSTSAPATASASSSPSRTRGKANTAAKISVNDTNYVSVTEVDEDADYRLALALSQSDDTNIPAASSQESKEAWSTLLAPTQVPVCTVHREPAKEFTVNKPGPNKGKRFFICSRPVGPGYDKGRFERLREHVDPQWRCDFFKWSSEVRKDMSRNGSNM